MQKVKEGNLMKIIFRFILVLLGAFLILYIAITSTSYAETNKFSMEIVETVNDEKDFYKFVKYQTILFKEIEIKETEQYKMGTYLVVSQVSNDKYKTENLLIIVPKQDVKHAATRTVDNDKTRFEIIKESSNETIFDTKTSLEHKDFPLSLGYSNDSIGFIYISFEVKETYNGTVNFYDYEGSLIEELNIKGEVINYNVTNNNDYINKGFELGYIVDEINEMIGLRQKIVSQALIYISIYLVLVYGSYAAYIIIKKVKNK